MTMTTDIVLSEAQKLGGAVELIVANRNELAKFTAGKVDDATALGLVKMVAENPTLNTEKRIAAIAWLASFHGEPIDQWLFDIHEEYQSEDILVVIDFLYEIAVRTGKGSPDEESVNIESRESVVSLLDFLEVYNEYQQHEELEIHSVESLNSVAEKLGGLVVISNIDTRDTLEEALSNTDE